MEAQNQQQSDQQPKQKGGCLKVAWIGLGVVAFIGIAVFIGSFLMDDVKPLDFEVVNQDETPRYVNINVSIKEKLDSANLVIIGSALRKDLIQDKKITIKFYLPVDVVGKDFVYANIVYPSNEDSREKIKDEDANGNKFILLIPNRQ